MSLFLRFAAAPTPLVLDHADHSLAAGVDMDVFNHDLLLPLATMAVESLQEGREGAGEFVCLIEIFPPTIEGLFAQHGATVALHRGVVGSDKLGCHHALQLVLRPDTDHCLDQSVHLLIESLCVRVLHP
ncbi:hypothetical protein [Thioalkalivibrio sp.]|uniref:hypothetical protein n=1 Tax=Thioalkalivibrio sp. TaxID=2093813 RepID=UPI0035682DEB